MGNFFRRLIWLIVVAAVLYGAYLAYLRLWNDGSLERAQQTASDFNSNTVGTAKDKLAGTVGQQAKEYASSVVSQAEGAVTAYIKQKASDALSALGTKVVDTVGSLIGTSTQHFPAGTVPLATSSGFLIPPPPATVVAKVNEPLIFSITRGVSYAVTWGDGKEETGTVPNDMTQLVSHAWVTPGDYTVNMTLKTANSTHTYSFPIRVY